MYATMHQVLLVVYQFIFNFCLCSFYLCVACFILYIIIYLNCFVASAIYHIGFLAIRYFCDTILITLIEMLMCLIYEYFLPYCFHPYKQVAGLIVFWHVATWFAGICEICSIKYKYLVKQIIWLWRRMAETISSFWGPVTSTIECCEKNYAYSSYIAEFYNTISNIPTILLAFIGLINAFRQRFEKRFSVLHVSNMTLAFGSMLYHATLQHV